MRRSWILLARQILNDRIATLRNGLNFLFESPIFDLLQQPLPDNLVQIHSLPLFQSIQFVQRDKYLHLLL